MRIGIDLDGVLYEWSKTARYMLREYKGYSRSGPMGAESTSWEYIKEHIEPKDWDWLWKEGVELGLFRYGHVVTGAQSGVRALREASHTVEVVTHRPSSSVPDTIAWLGLFQKPEAGVVFDGIHILTNGERKSSVGTDVLIDDKPSNIEDVVGHGKRAILFDREWNQGAKPAGSVRAYGWEHVVKLVEAMNVNGAVGGHDRGTDGNSHSLRRDVGDSDARWAEETRGWTQTQMGHRPYAPQTHVQSPGSVRSREQGRPRQWRAPADPRGVESAGGGVAGDTPR